MACIDTTDPTIVLTACNTASQFEASTFYTKSQYGTYGNDKGQHYARGPLRMDGYQDYWNFQQITETMVFLDPFSVIYDEATFWATGLYKWMVWDDDVLSPHLAITNQVPLSRAQIYAGIKPGFGQTMIMNDAAICGFYSYEQDILVSFYNKFLTAFSVDAAVTANDDNWCKKYRNADYAVGFDTYWIMPADPITASTSNLAKPTYYDAACLNTATTTFSNTNAYLSITEPNAWRQCVLWGDLAVKSQVLKEQPHLKMLEQGENFGKLEAFLASELTGYDDDWDFAGWYNVYTDDTTGSAFTKLNWKFQNDEFFLWKLVPDHRLGVKLSYENYWGEGPKSAPVYFWPQSAPELVTLKSVEREIYSYSKNQTGHGAFSTTWNYPNDNGGFIYEFMHCQNGNFTIWNCWKTTGVNRVWVDTDMTGLWVREYVMTQNKYANSQKAFKWTFSARRPRPANTLTDSLQTWIATQKSSPVTLYGDNKPTTNANQMVISWDQDNTDIGSDVIDYKVWWNQGETIDTWIVLDSALTAKTLTVTTGVKGERHTFRIESRNEVGYNSYLWDKEYSDLLQSYQYEIPATTVNGTVTQANSDWFSATDVVVAGKLLDEVEFSWYLPDDGGSPITGAQIRFCHPTTGTKNWEFNSNHADALTKKNSFFSDRHWLTEDYFTARISMADIVSVSGFYWSDIAPVTAMFKNYLGGIWPGDEVQASVAADCNSVDDVKYLGATAWGDLKLIKLPDPPMTLAEVTASTDENKMTYSWSYPEDNTWSLSNYYSSS